MELMRAADSLQGGLLQPLLSMVGGSLMKEDAAERLWGEIRQVCLLGEDSEGAVRCWPLSLHPSILSYRLNPPFFLSHYFSPAPPPVRLLSLTLCFIVLRDLVERVLPCDASVNNILEFSYFFSLMLDVWANSDFFVVVVVFS